jgi:hypothetical protein
LKMSWASVYWDLEHIIHAARLAIEAAYALEQAAHANAPLSDPIRPQEISARRDLDALSAGVNVPLEISVLTGAAESIEVSLSKASLAAKALTEDKSAVQVRNLWTPEIEAALRDFLRPLSVNLRYEYRFPDTLDEKRSIAAMNSLFRHRPKSDEIRIRDVSVRNELRRKLYDLRRPGISPVNARRPSPPGRLLLPQLNDPFV